MTNIAGNCYNLYRKRAKLCPVFTNRKERYKTMEKNITATMNKNSVTVRVFEKATRQLFTTDETFFGSYNESVKRVIRAMYEQNNCMVVKFYDDSVQIKESAKYAIPESKFYELAEVMEKRPNGDYISRTATASKCEVLVYNNYTDDTEVKYHIVSGKNAEKVQKAIERIYKKSDYTVLTVDIVETINALYVLDADTFFANATEI